MINPDDSEIGHRELADLLREDIRSGALAPGSRLPSESTLSQMYGINPSTARRAVQLLRNEGLAVSVRGLGVVVAEPPELEDFFVDEGTVVTSRPPSLEERERHGIPEGWPILHVVYPKGGGDLLSAYKFRVVFRAAAANEATNGS